MTPNFDYGVRRNGKIVAHFHGEANAIGDCRHEQSGTVVFLPTDTPIWQYGHGWIDRWNPVCKEGQS